MDNNQQTAVMQHLHSEIKDIHEYIQLWHETNNGIYKDIAIEEMSHAKALKELADAHGWDLTEIMQEWHQAEEQMHKH